MMFCFRSPTFLSLKYDPDVDSKAGVECVGGEWDTSDMPTTDDCNDDVRGDHLDQIQ